MPLAPVEVNTHVRTTKSVLAYPWADIEKAVFEKMGLSQSGSPEIGPDTTRLRNDFWSVCLDTVLQDQVENGETATMCGGAGGLAFESFKQASPNWSHPFFDALESVFTEIDPNSDEFLVYFEW